MAKDFHQGEVQDYDLTYYLVVKAETIMIILFIATAQEWKLHHIIVCNAFLNGKLDEEVFIEQLPGHHHGKFLDHVCKLPRALYRLKWAP